MEPFANSGGNGQNPDDLHNLFFGNLLSTLPELNAAKRSHDEQFIMNGNNLFSGRRFTNNYNIESSTPIDIFGNNGASQMRNNTPKTSPQTDSSASSSPVVFCVHCDETAASRCLDCNDVYCADCINKHLNLNAFTSQHTVVGLGKITPIGSAPTNSIFHNFDILSMTMNEQQCEIHNEALRFLCETCKKVVCQECTLKDHKDHSQIPIANLTLEKCKEKFKAILKNSQLGDRSVRASIDRNLICSQSTERHSNEEISKVRKAFKIIIKGIEDREQCLLEQIEKYRYQKVASLTDQMTGLRKILLGLSEVYNSSTNFADSIDSKAKIDVAFFLAKTESQIDDYVSMYKNLQPKEESLSFLEPSFEFLQKIKNQGEIVINCKSNGNYQNNNNYNGSAIPPHSLPSASSLMQRQLTRASSSPSNGDQLFWNPTESSNIAVGVGSSHVTSAKTYASIVKPASTSPIIGQCVPGSNSHISVRHSIAPSLTFCYDGPEDGQVARPWGVCVNKNNEIIIADRRNNRIQVFSADGLFKFRFGVKGTGNGQFDLPAGVAADQSNRIVVVDKDNHRIQIFSSKGVFIHKFGEFGKDLSQFMYPWACAVNTKSQILVTDSRNHRIQLFSPDGHFISRFSFDGVNHSRFLKGLTTPRGVAFNPQGHIIISDFENHRLILIDSSMTKIILTKGHEGTAVHEFCRPSGICCDDDGNIVVADSKNQRVLIFSSTLEFMSAVEIRPSSHNLLTSNMDDKDRPSDVALLNDGRLIVLVETSPDSKEAIPPHKTFVQVY